MNIPDPLDCRSIEFAKEYANSVMRLNDLDRKAYLFVDTFRLMGKISYLEQYITDLEKRLNHDN